MTSYDEARACPKCTQPGEETQEIAAPRGPGITRGARLKLFVCRNGRCKWCDGAPWMVQTNPDGSIPPPDLRREKKYRELPDDGGRTEQNLQELLRTEQMPGAEMRGW